MKNLKLIILFVLAFYILNEFTEALILYLGGIYHEDLERITDDTPGDNGSE